MRQIRLALKTTLEASSHLVKTHGVSLRDMSTKEQMKKLKFRKSFLRLKNKQGQFPGSDWTFGILGTKEKKNPCSVEHFIVRVKFKATEIEIEIGQNLQIEFRPNTFDHGNVPEF